MGKPIPGFRLGQVVSYRYSMSGKPHGAWGKVVGGGTHAHLGKVLLVRPYGDKDYPAIPVTRQETRKLPYTPRHPGKNEIWDWSPLDKDTAMRRKHGLKS